MNLKKTLKLVVPVVLISTLIISNHGIGANTTTADISTDLVETEQSNWELISSETPDEQGYDDAEEDKVDTDNEEEETEIDGDDDRGLPVPTFVVPATGGVVPPGEVGIVESDVEGNITVAGSNTALVLMDDYTITGTVILTNESTFFMTDGTITGVGTRGITASGNSMIYMSGGQITGNEALATDLNGNGGGVHLSGGSSMVMSNAAQITNNTSHGISVCGPPASAAQLDGGSGGGVFVANSSQLQMQEGQIFENQTNSCRIGGGGVRVASGGTFIKEAGAIHSNHSIHTGAAQASTGGGAVNNSGTFTMEAGAIYNNTVSHNGGGVFNNGIFNFAGGVIGHEDRTYGNTAGGGGGGIHIGGASAVLNLSNDVYIIGNNANGTGGGGGITRTAGAINTTPGATVNVFNNRVHGSNNGGGLRLINAMTMSFEGWHIYNNEAHHGGGVQLTNGTFIFGNSVIENNRARSHGGGARLEGATLIMTDETSMIHGNTSTGDGGGISITNSGAALGHLVIENGSIDWNQANFGGGVRVETGLLTMQGGNIHHNTAIGSGGGVSITNALSIFELENGHIHNNHSESTTAGGGGVRVMNGATFTMHGGSIHTNLSVPTTGTASATNGGGGVSNSAATFNMHGGSIYNNIATSQGGGIRSDAGAFNWHGGVIGHGNAAYGNRANNAGGGIHIHSGAFNIQGESPKYLIGNQTLNTLENQGGGGLNLVGGSINTALNTGLVLIENNTTASDGGGLRTMTGMVEATEDWIVRENSAIGNGGGAFAGATGQLVLDGSLFEGNTGENGGALALEDRATLIMRGTTRLVDNEARTNGGAVHLNHSNVSFLMENGEISHNVAASDGGGIWEQDSDFNIYAGVISNNRAINGDGGGIFTNDYEYEYMLTDTAYGNITIGERVIFSRNQASRGPLNPANPEIATNIQTRSTSVPLLHPLNNFDINYYYRHTDLDLTKVSNPASGTTSQPTEVTQGDFIEYRITFHNNGNTYVTNLIIEDLLPDHLNLYPLGLDVLDLEGYFVHQNLCEFDGNDEDFCDGFPTENLGPQPIRNLSSVDVTMDGRMIRWTIDHVFPGDTFTLIIPTQVSDTAPQGIRFENTATVVSEHADDEPIISETTYHRTPEHPPITGLRSDINLNIIILLVSSIGVVILLYLNRWKRNVANRSH